MLRMLTSRFFPLKTKTVEEAHSKLVFFILGVVCLCSREGHSIEVRIDKEGKDNKERRKKNHGTAFDKGL